MLKKELEHAAKVIENIGEYGKRVSRGQYGGGTPNNNSRGSGRAAPRQTNNNTANAQTLPHTRSRLLRLNEIEDAGGKIQYGASQVNRAAGIAAAGEDIADEYRRYKTDSYFKKLAKNKKL